MPPLVKNGKLRESKPENGSPFFSETIFPPPEFTRGVVKRGVTTRFGPASKLMAATAERGKKGEKGEKGRSNPVCVAPNGVLVFGRCSVRHVGGGGLPKSNRGPGAFRPRRSLEPVFNKPGV